MCDQSKDCSDGSDEASCSKILNYNQSSFQHTCSRNFVCTTYLPTLTHHTSYCIDNVVHTLYLLEMAFVVLVLKCCNFVFVYRRIYLVSVLFYTVFNYSVLFFYCSLSFGDGLYTIMDLLNILFLISLPQSPWYPLNRHEKLFKLTNFLIQVQLPYGKHQISRYIS